MARNFAAVIDRFGAKEVVSWISLKSSSVESRLTGNLRFSLSGPNAVTIPAISSRIPISGRMWDYEHPDILKLLPRKPVNSSFPRFHGETKEKEGS